MTSSMSHDEGQLPLAVAVVSGLSATVSAFGDIRECTAADREALEDQVMSLLLAAAESAGGQLHVRIEGDEPGEFVLTPAGETLPVPAVEPVPVAAADPVLDDAAVAPALVEPAEVQPMRVAAPADWPAPGPDRWVAAGRLAVEYLAAQVDEQGDESDGLGRVAT